MVVDQHESQRTSLCGCTGSEKLSAPAVDPHRRRSLRDMNVHHGPNHEQPRGAAGRATVVLHVGGQRFATEAAVAEHAIGRQPGVLGVLANPSAQTATVTYDPGQTSVTALQRCVEECGYQCTGQSVPALRRRC